MIVGVLTTCHTQYTWVSCICIFFFNIITLQVFFTYITGALYVHPLWFHKHQHDNRVRSKLFVACLRWWFQWRFASILVNCAASGEMHNYCTPHIIKENSENFLIHRCNYILLSQVYCAWQVVKTPKIIFNNAVYIYIYIYFFFFSWHNSPTEGQDLLITKASRSHSDAPHSVGLLLMIDRPIAETSTWHTTLTIDRHPCPRRGWTHSPSKRTAADPRLRPRGHWDRQWDL
jgi:hypothetical protein